MASFPDIDSAIGIVKLCEITTSPYGYLSYKGKLINPDKAYASKPYQEPYEGEPKPIKSETQPNQKLILLLCN